MKVTRQAFFLSYFCVRLIRGPLPREWHMTQTHLTYAPPPGSEPARIGDHPALDFLNSVLAPAGVWIDFIHDGPSLVRWLSQTTAVPRAHAIAAASFTPKQLDHLAAEARELREWFRALVQRWLADGDRAVRASDIQRLNKQLGGSLLSQSIERRPEGFELRVQRAQNEPSSLLAELAAVCADLLAHRRPEEVRKCENPSCTLIFADTKRGPRRRWCSMAVCGNRMKAAAHRSRQRG